MPFCTSCGAEALSNDRFCSSCGRAVGGTRPVETGERQEGPAGRLLPYRIPARRVLLMSVLSYGLYLLYWFYLTWKQYRDHTRDPVFPVWHALTLFVPIYGLFRTHAHMRTYKGLMLDAGIGTSIGPGVAVLVLLVSSILGWSSFQVGGDFGFEQITRGQAAATAVLDIIAITLVAGLLVHMQANLNTYWRHQTETNPALSLTAARIGVGEVIFCLVGVLAWFGTIGAVVSPSFVTGPA